MKLRIHIEGKGQGPFSDQRVTRYYRDEACYASFARDSRRSVWGG